MAKLFILFYKKNAVSIVQYCWNHIGGSHHYSLLLGSRMWVRSFHETTLPYWQMALQLNARRVSSTMMCVYSKHWKLVLHWRDSACAIYSWHFHRIGASAESVYVNSKNLAEMKFTLVRNNEQYYRWFMLAFWLTIFLAHGGAEFVMFSNPLTTTELSSNFMRHKP
jgi:hypothetical protein